MNYVEKHGNQAGERHFGSPPTEKMIQEWRKQRKDLIKADKSEKSLHLCAPTQPKLEEYLKNWIIDHRKNGIAVSTKIILIEARRLATEKSITDFSETTLWCERFMLYTVVLACCADGTRLPNLLIFKTKALPKDVIQHGIYVHVYSKGWMDGEGMKQLWLQKVWSKHPGGLLKKPSLLVCDQFKAHVTEPPNRLATKPKTHLAVIPGGLTSQLQPLDILVNKPFKGFIHD